MAGRMFWTRLASGITLVALALVFIMAGGPVLAAGLCLISLSAYRELGRALGFLTDDPDRRALVYTGMILTVLYYLWVYLQMREPWSGKYRTMDSVWLWYASLQTARDRALVIGITAAFIVFLFVYVFRFPKYHGRDVTAACFSFLYGPVMLSFLYLIRMGFADGKYLVWLVFLCSWGSDTCAYAVGMLIGRHKMTPRLSPKKSVEGAVGGVVGAALLVMLYVYLAGGAFSLPLWQAALLGASGAAVSMVGDLAASAFKRDYGIKDYGKLIPGHGGIMDRFDSVIIAAPLIFIGLSFMK